jgi:hypothetical protein
MSASEESQTSPVRAFISYSYDSPEHCEQVLALAQQLRRDGIDAELDQFEEAQSRGRDLLSDILGKDFGGVLVSDCLAIYDGATRLQQKCYAHHHKAIRKAKDLHPLQGEGFLCEVAALDAPTSFNKASRGHLASTNGLRFKCKSLRFTCNRHPPDFLALS